MACATPFDPFHRVVMNMMARFGGDSELKIVAGEEEYDPSTSTSLQRIDTYPIRTIVFDYTDKKDGEFVALPGQTEKSYKRMFVKPSDFPRPTPLVDKASYQGSDWTIATVKEINTSGTDSVLYEFMIYR